MRFRPLPLRSLGFSTCVLLVTACTADPYAAAVADAESPSDELQGPSDENDAGAGQGADHGASLSIEPATAILVITERGQPVSGQFQAHLKVGGTPLENVRWRVSGDLVDVDEHGKVTTRGLSAGEVELSASYGEQHVTANIFVSVALREVGEGVSAMNLQALERTAELDPGLALAPPNPSKLLYPYDQTVMPRGLNSPTLQLSPGSLPPEDVRLYVSAEGFGWDGFLHVDTPLTPRLTIPQDVWDGALASAGGGSVTFEITKASSGAVYGPITSGIIAADASLKGTIYYMTYDEAALGLWSTRPGQGDSPKQIMSGCTVCHAASADGRRLSVGADPSTELPRSGVYQVGSNGSATQIAAAPNDLGGDSRGLSMATFTPDGEYVMRSQNDFWGGVNQRAFRIDGAGGTLLEASVLGLGLEVSAYLPTFAPDGRRYAFTNGAGEGMPFGSVGRSLSIMDVSIDPALGSAGTLTFTNRQLLLDNGPEGSVVKFVTFLPDANRLVYQEGEGYAMQYGEMAPTWDELSSFHASTGRLAMVDTSTKAQVTLERLNQGNLPSDAQRNYEPVALPVSVGGYDWVVFTSIRDYGNTYQGNDARKQLWVAAISPNVQTGEDPSHPAFLLPNQGATRNERGFWALDACRKQGESCSTADECCEGSCLLSGDLGAGRICAPPVEDLACSAPNDPCEIDADCCGVAQGVMCVGGRCDGKGPALE